MSSPAFSQEKIANNPELAKLFTNSGGKQVAKKFEIQLLAKYSKKLTSIYEKVPEEFWDDFFEAMIPDEEIESILASTYNVYGKFFTAEEIDLLNRYLMVPALQKWVELSPKIAKEQALIMEKESKAFLTDTVFNEKLGKLEEKYVFDKSRNSIMKKEQKKAMTPRTR
jgi:hypothetical protein